MELRSDAGDRDSVLAEVEFCRLPSCFGFEHAVAGFGCAAGFRNDQHERVGKAERFDFFQHCVHAGGIGVVEEKDWQLRVSAERFGDELRAECRATDADEEKLFEG